MPGGPQFADALRRCWDDNDAALPLDLRLAEPAIARIVEALRASVVLDASGHSACLPGGEPVEEGDALVVTTSGTTGEPKGADEPGNERLPLLARLLVPQPGFA